MILPAVKDHNALIGTCLDTGHLIRAAQLGKKLDPAEEVRKMGARNFGIHLKDCDNETKLEVIFGRGNLDVPGLLKALRDVKFRGMISIEYEAKEEEPTDDVRRGSAGFQGRGEETGLSGAGQGSRRFRGRGERKRPVRAVSSTARSLRRGRRGNTTIMDLSDLAFIWKRP